MQISAFKRAAHDALATGRTYVEGFVMLNDGAPIEHAWTVDKHGIVFDSVHGSKVAVGGYYGVPVPTDILTRVLVKTRRYGVLNTRMGKRLLSNDDWSEADHPRGQPGNAGQFGSGGGGGKSTESAKSSGKGDHPGKGYSKEARVVNGKIQTSNVQDATRALYEKREVELKQPREVSTLIDHLGKVSAGFVKLGAKAPVFDLCKVSVKGTNLFCAETTGIPRIKMPQLRKGEEEKFNQYLKDNGYGVKDTTELASHLRATQSEIGGARVAKIIGQLRKDSKNLERRVTVSKDNYILDGHHFWAARLGYAAADNDLTENTRMNVSRVDISIVDLLDEAEKFTKGAGKVGVGDKRFGAKDDWREADHPRGQPGNKGQFGPGGGGSSGEAKGQPPAQAGGGGGGAPKAAATPGGRPEARGQTTPQAPQKAAQEQPAQTTHPSGLSPEEISKRVAVADKRALELAKNQTNLINTPERQKLRAKLVDDIYNIGIESRQRNRDATIILGLPAAGKSTVANPILKEKGALEVDPDIAKGMLPEFENGVGASAVHEESSEITKEVLKRALDNGDNLVWPRVDSPDKIAADIKRLRERGYKIHVRHLEVSMDTAVQSATDRFLKTGRYVPLNMIREFGDSPLQTYKNARHLADSAEAFQRSHGGGISPLSIDAAGGEEDEETQSQLPPGLLDTPDALKIGKIRHKQVEKEESDLSDTIAEISRNGPAGDSDFNESDHPRDKSGKFGSGGGKHDEHVAAFEKSPDYESFEKELNERTKGMSKADLDDLSAKYAHTVPGSIKTKAQAIKHLSQAYVRKRRFENKLSSDESLALDRGSVRELDQDGRLDVAVTNISKANVCPYLGGEIPGYEELRLDPDRVYMLLRDPRELARAATSFCNLPVLDRHVPVFAEDYAAEAKKHVVGSTGSDCVFQPPYLRCSLKIWDGDAIKAIQSGEQKELSCGYHYKPVMKPGIYEGAKYDGVMTDIVGNHVALVKEGRVGSDVVVGDSKEKVMKKRPMTRTAAIAIGVLAPYVKSKLAADKGLDLRPILCGLTAADLRDRGPAIAASIKKACRGKLAKDTTLGEVAEFLDMLQAHGGEIDESEADAAVEPEVQKAMEGTAMLEPQEPEPGGAPGAAPGAPPPAAPGAPGAPPKAGMEAPPPGGELEEDDESEELKNFLRGKLSEEDFAHACEMMGAGAAAVEDEGEVGPGGEEKKGEERLKALGAEGGDPEEAEEEGEKDPVTGDEPEEEEDMTKDNPPEFKGSPRPGGKPVGDKKYVTKDELERAMKSAAEAARKIERDIREAERIVQPWVGNLAMTFDSSEQVYRKTLKMLGVPGVDRVHESALRTILEMQPKPGTRKGPTPQPAHDESIQVGSFFERYPDAGRIRLT